METRTTAQLRDQARDAEDRGQYLTASELYPLAITRSPVNVNSQPARADIDDLRARSKRCLDAHLESTGQVRQLRERASSWAPWSLRIPRSSHSTCSPSNPGPPL